MSSEGTMDHVRTLPFTEQIRQLVLDDASSIEAVRSGEMAGWETALGRMYLQWSGLQIANGYPIILENETFAVTGETKTLTKSPQSPIPEISLNISPGTLVGSFASPPSELVEFFQSGSANFDKKNQIVKDTIKNAKNVLLAGAIIPGSVQSLMSELSQFGFQGTIDVVDISSLSIQMLELFTPYLEQKFPGIRLNLIQSDLSHITVDSELKQSKIVHGSLGESLHVPEHIWDIAVFDVIGTYVSDSNIEELALLLGGVKDSGLSFIRDMAEFPVEIDNSTRLVDPENQRNRLGEFKQWLYDSFNLDISEGDIEDVANNIFLKNTTHTERMDQLLFLWSQAITHGRPDFNVLEFFNFYPKGGDPNERYFLNMLVGKRI